MHRSNVGQSGKQLNAVVVTKHTRTSRVGRGAAWSGTRTDVAQGRGKVASAAAEALLLEHVGDVLQLFLRGLPDPYYDTHVQIVHPSVGLQGVAEERSRATLRKHAACTHITRASKTASKRASKRAKRRDREVRTQVPRDEGVQVPRHGVAVQMDVGDVLGPQAAPQLRAGVEVVPAVVTRMERIGERVRKYRERERGSVG